MNSIPPLGVRLRFHGGLDYFLKQSAGEREIRRALSEPTSVKDIIESCGVPHSEVDRILVGGRAVDFQYVIRNAAEIDVYPVGTADLPGEPLQQRHLERFVADGHLGKLVRNLRLLGIDVVYDNQLDDPGLLDVMQSDQRALLTRDRRLLMHRIVIDGYCPRSSEPMTQTVEVVRRFQLSPNLKPFTRCLQCNGLLEQVDKAAVINQLEPLTRIYYEEFRSCTVCGKIFWRGSHFSKLEGFLERFRHALGAVTGTT